MVSVFLPCSFPPPTSASNLWSSSSFLGLSCHKSRLCSSGHRGNSSRGTRCSGSGACCWCGNAHEMLMLLLLLLWQPKARCLAVSRSFMPVDWTWKKNRWSNVNLGDSASVMPPPPPPLVLLLLLLETDSSTGCRVALTRSVKEPTPGGRRYFSESKDQSGEAMSWRSWDEEHQQHPLCCSVSLFTLRGAEPEAERANGRLEA